MWANLHLLFWLSLFPFVTGWMGENHFAPVPTALYGGVSCSRGDRLLHSAEPSSSQRTAAIRNWRRPSAGISRASCLRSSTPLRFRPRCFSPGWPGASMCLWPYVAHPRPSYCASGRRIGVVPALISSCEIAEHRGDVPTASQCLTRSARRVAERGGQVARATQAESLGLALPLVVRFHDRARTGALQPFECGRSPRR